MNLATRLVESCSGASISAIIDGEASSAAVSDRVTLQVDSVQYDNSEGPSLMALGGDVIRVGFVPIDERFPHFVIGAADRRVLSVLATPIIDHGIVPGTLNMYSQQRDGFDGPDERVAAILTAECAAAMVKSVLMSNSQL